MNTTYHYRRVALLFIAFIYLLNYFMQNTLLTVIYSLILISIIIMTIPGMAKTNLTVSLCLFLAGSIILVVKEVPLLSWSTALAKNAGLVALFVTVPLLGLPFFYENYQEELKHLAAKYMKTLPAFCLLTAVAAHLLGVIMNLGAVPLVYELFVGTARLYKAEKAFLAALLQGYVLSGLWSPAWSSMGIITGTVTVTWAQIIPYGILFAAACIGIIIIFIGVEIYRNPQRYSSMQFDPTVRIKWSSIIYIIVLISSIILSTLLVNMVTSWNLLVIIPLISLVFPVLAALIGRKLPAYIKGMYNYYNHKLIRIGNEVVLFTAAGFLGKALELSGINQVIPRLLPAWVTSIPYLAILLLVVIMVVISMLGVHPVVTGTAFVSSINPLSMGLTPLAFAFAILTGWCTCTLLSPFSGASLVSAGLTGRASWNISLKINGMYGLFAVLFLSFLIAVFL